MTPEELQRSVKELSRFAETFLAKANAENSPEAERFSARIAYVLTNTASLVVECKSQLDAVVSMERRRDRSPADLRDERAIVFFARLKPEDRERLVRTVEGGPPNISVEAFAEQVSNVTQFKRWDVDGLLRWLLRYYPYLAQRETEDAVNTIADILTAPFNLEGEARELLQAVDAQNRNSPFTQQLKRLLRCHMTLGVTSKAEMLVGRNERQFSP